MNSIDDIYFDICEFTCTDSIREIVVRSAGRELKITGTEITKIDDLDFWIVPSHPVESLFGKYYNSAYPRFFGILLNFLQKNKPNMPIINICLGDIARACEDDKNSANELANRIALNDF